MKKYYRAGSSVLMSDRPGQRMVAVACAANDAYAQIIVDALNARHEAYVAVKA